MSRICLVDPAVVRHAPAGGQMRLLAAELARRHEVTVVTAACDPELQSKVRWIRIRFEHGFLRNLWELERRVVAALEGLRSSGEEFDVVHATMPVAVPEGVARGLVVTWHFCAAGAWRVWRSGGMRYRGRGLSNRVFYNVAGWLRWGLPVVREQLAVRRLRSARSVWVAVSKGLAGELVRYLGAREGEVRIAPMAVDRRYFEAGKAARDAVRSAMGIQEHEVLVVTVAHGQWGRKGTFEVLAALRSLERCVKLAVVGGSRLEHLRREARALGVEERVVFCGSADPLPYLTAAEVFVFPSWYEAWPLAAAEAAAVGLPVVASRVSGVVEWLEDGRSGLFCEPKAESIAACLGTLATDAELRREIGRGAQQAVARYTPEAMAAEYERIYAELSEMSAAS